MFSREDLRRDFAQLGVASGDTVLLHASVRAVGRLLGGPDQIHLALRDALGPDGTLMMYAGCESYYDDVGRDVLPEEVEREVLQRHPPFDPLTARSCRAHGILVEFFRTWPGTLVNEHTARFAAAGKHAGTMVAAHPWNYPYGAGTPLHRFVELGGKILLLGSDHDEVTFLHHVEHVVAFSGKRVASYKVPVLENGRTVWHATEEFNTAGDGVHPNWPERYFAELVDGYLAESGNAGSLVGNARSYLFPARELLAFAGPRMQLKAGSQVE